MAVGTNYFPYMAPITGVQLGTASAGIKKPDRKDLVVIEIQTGALVSAVFTRNAFCAAPVTIAKQNLAAGTPRYLLINTGNANAGTGSKGLEDATACCQQLAELTGVHSDQVLPFSTGVIGEPLPVDIICRSLPDAINAINDKGWDEAAHGILTTDTRPKGASKSFQHQGKVITITGIAKGAGMIRPDMATMLAFLATDAALEQPLLDQALQEAVSASFNRITIDGDTSTNDACVLIATGCSDQAVTTKNNTLYDLFKNTLTEVCLDLAQAIIKDGEGATKFVTVTVEGGNTTDECLQVAYAIAHSPLVKTALFASDPNWGRILAVVGRAGLNNLDVNRVSIYLDSVCIVDKGGLSATYTEVQGQEVMSREEILIRVVLGRGEAAETVWTTDLSHDYVSINSDYRS
jgi:glutamate N-acetyltransferase/amino-acid N-acetyltransferase